MTHLEDQRTAERGDILAMPGLLDVPTADRLIEQETMTAAWAGDPVAEAAPSLEVRWMFPGPLEAAVTGWFGRFRAETESREDTYLLRPDMPGLSVKIRAGGALEVKAYRGSRGIDVPGRARGRLQAWQKWSFPFCPAGWADGDHAGWGTVRKLRRISRFPAAGGQAGPRVPGLTERSACAVELTEIHARGEAWWSLGLEATGAPGLLRGGLMRTAALVFAQPLPGGVQIGIGDSGSYAEWLRRRPYAGPGSGA